VTSSYQGLSSTRAKSLGTRLDGELNYLNNLVPRAFARFRGSGTGKALGTRLLLKLDPKYVYVRMKNARHNFLKTITSVLTCLFIITVIIITTKILTAGHKEQILVQIYFASKRTSDNINPKETVFSKHMLSNSK
jgi:hypothetical protein